MVRESTKSLLRKAGFHKEVEKVESGFCPTCSKPIVKDEFRDKLSKEEFDISGMCQKCQDEIFKEQ